MWRINNTKEWIKRTQNSPFTTDLVALSAQAEERQRARAQERERQERSRRKQREQAESESFRSAFSEAKEAEQRRAQRRILVEGTSPAMHLAVRAD